ncbi:hypothetical protein QQ045_015190 [Rhodiola kirilowii]
MDPFDFDENRRRYEQQRRESDIITNSFIMDAAVLATIDDEDTPPPRHFRRRYRMSSNLFNRIKPALCNHDTFWHQRPDATRLLGLLPEQKMTGVIRMLAYGSCADQCAELTRMGESTTLKCRKGHPTIILEAVASYDTWIWHSFIGVLGAQNDLNVLYKSDIFDPLFAGISPRVTYKVNGSTYDTSYFLADDIYPRYSSFVKTIPNPQNDAEKLFSKKQESYRKDVERCFGILQSRWAILSHTGMTHRLSVLKNIMLACIIMHNMIIEDEFIEHEEEDLYNPSIAFTVYDGSVDPNGNRIHMTQLKEPNDRKRFIIVLLLFSLHIYIPNFKMT